MFRLIVIKQLISKKNKLNEPNKPEHCGWERGGHLGVRSNRTSEQPFQSVSSSRGSAPRALTVRRIARPAEVRPPDADARRATLLCKIPLVL